MSVIVLTGYGGLLGKAVLAELVARGDDVVCFGRRAPSSGGRATYIAADLADREFVARLPARADAVIHLAQADNYSRFPECAAEVFRVNVAAVSELLDWGSRAGIRHFIHASSGGVYGGGPDPIAEAHPLDCKGPIEHYLTTKRVAELLGETYASKFTVAALRYFFIYGAGQKASMLMPRLIASVKAGQPLKLAGQHGLKLNPIHASDAARATVAALGLASSGTINVGGPEVLTLRQIGEAIGAATGRRPQFELDPREPRHLIADISRMREQLAPPTVRFANGILDLCRD